MPLVFLHLDSNPGHFSCSYTFLAASLVSVYNIQTLYKPHRQSAANQCSFELMPSDRTLKLRKNRISLLAKWI